MQAEPTPDLPPDSSSEAMEPDAPQDVSAATDSPAVSQIAADLEQERHQRQQAEAEKETLAIANRKDRRRLRIGAGLLAASSLVAAVAIHSAISSSRMAYQSQQELSLQLQRFEDERNLAQQASRIPLTAPNQLNPSAEGMSLEEQGQALIRQSAQYPGQVQDLVEALQLGYALKAQLPAANAQSDRLTLQNYPAHSPLLALRMTTSSLMKQLDEQPRNGGKSQTKTSDDSGLSSIQSNGAALFDLVEHPFVNELFADWAPDSQGLVTYSQSKDRSYLRSFDGVEQASFECRFVGFTPDGQRVLTMTQHDPFIANDSDLQPVSTLVETIDARFRLWSLDGVEQASFEGRFVGFNPDGQGLLIFTKGDDTLRLWGFDGQERASFKGELKQFTPDGQGLLTVSSGDYQMRLWSLHGVEQASFEGRFRGLSPDDQGIVTESYLLSDSRLGRWWNPGGIRATQLWNLDGTKQAVVKGYFQAFTPDGQGLATFYWAGEEYTWGDYIASKIPWVSWPGSQAEETYVWTRDGEEQARVEGYFQAFTPDGQGLITYVDSMEKGRWQTLMDNLRSHLEHRNAAFASMMRIDHAGTTHLWSLDGERRASLAGDFASFTPDGQGLVTNYIGDGPSYAYLWSLGREKQVSFEGRFVGFTPDGQGLMTNYIGDDQEYVHLWSLDGEKQVSFEGRFVGFTPDGQGLVTSGVVNGQSAARLWNLNGEEQASFAGSFSGFIPNSQGLSTRSDHETTILWSFEGYPLAEVTGVIHAKSDFLPEDTGFSDDGRFLLTAPADLNQPLTYRIWPMDNGLDDLLSRGCNLLASHFRANPSQREDLGICLDQPL